MPSIVAQHFPADMLRVVIEPQIKCLMLGAFHLCLFKVLKAAILSVCYMFVLECSKMLLVPWLRLNYLLRVIMCTVAIDNYPIYTFYLDRVFYLDNSN